jgi:hypothetical protein
MITIFFTARKPIVPNVLPKGNKFHQPYFVDYIFPDLKRENVTFHRRIPQATFWVHMDNSICHNGSKVGSNFEKHDGSRLPHTLYSLHISPCHSWPFGMLKVVLKDREFNSNDEIEGAIAKVRGELTLNEVQSVFHNWVNHLA